MFVGSYFFLASLVVVEMWVLGFWEIVELKSEVSEVKIKVYFKRCYILCRYMYCFLKV